MRAGAVISAALGTISYAAQGVAGDIERTFAALARDPGETTESLAMLRKAVLDLAHDVPQGFSEIGAVVDDLADKLGYAGEPLKEFSRQILDASRMTREDSGAMAASVAQAFNKWGVEAEDAGAHLDMLYTLAQGTGVSLVAMAMELATSGASLQGMGMSFSQAAAMLSEFNRVGIDTGPVMMALKKAFSDIAASGGDPSAGFASLVTSIRDAETAAQATGIAAQALGARAGPEFAAAIRSGALSIEALTGRLEEVRGAISNAAGDTQTLEDRWGIVWNRMSLLIAPVGEGIRGVLRNGTELIDALISWAGKTDVVKKSFDALCGGLTGGVPSVEGFRRVLESIDVEDLVREFRSFGEGVRHVVAGLKSLASAVPWKFIADHAKLILELIVGGWAAGKVTIAYAGIFKIGKAFVDLSGGVSRFAQNVRTNLAFARQAAIAESARMQAAWKSWGKMDIRVYNAAPMETEFAKMSKAAQRTASATDEAGRNISKAWRGVQGGLREASKVGAESAKKLAEGMDTVVTGSQVASAAVRSLGVAVKAVALSVAQHMVVISVIYGAIQGITRLVSGLREATAAEQTYAEVKKQTFEILKRQNAEDLERQRDRLQARITTLEERSKGGGSGFLGVNVGEQRQLEEYRAELERVLRALREVADAQLDLAEAKKIHEGELSRKKPSTTGELEQLKKASAAAKALHAGFVATEMDLESLNERVVAVGDAMKTAVSNGLPEADAAKSAMKDVRQAVQDALEGIRKAGGGAFDEALFLKSFRESTKKLPPEAREIARKVLAELRGDKIDEILDFGPMVSQVRADMETIGERVSAALSQGLIDARQETGVLAEDIRDAISAPLAKMSSAVDKTTFLNAVESMAQGLDGKLGEAARSAVSDLNRIGEAVRDAEREASTVSAPMSPMSHWEREAEERLQQVLEFNRRAAAERRKAAATKGQDFDYVKKLWSGLKPGDLPKAPGRDEGSRAQEKAAEKADLASTRMESAGKSIGDAASRIEQAGSALSSSADRLFSAATTLSGFRDLLHKLLRGVDNMGVTMARHMAALDMNTIAVRENTSATQQLTSAMKNHQKTATASPSGAALGPAY